MNFAPVIIPTLCRFEHLKRCIESLSRCTFADQTELYIALDYPANDSHYDGWKKIKEYLPTIKGFKNVIVHERTKNYGSRKNFIMMRDYCYSIGYDRYIYSEDDNEFSPNFLDYINKGLEKYNGDTKVGAICAFTPPVDLSGYEKNIYATYEYSAWGIGIWKDKELEKSRDLVQQILRSPSKCWQIFRKEPRILYTLYRMMNKGGLYGDTFSVSYGILNNRFSVFPTISKVRNWGNDGSGEHCDKLTDQKYTAQSIDNQATFDYDDITIEETQFASLKKHALLSWKQILKFPYQIIRYYL